MRSTFFGLEIGRRAIMAQRKALDVTGHNIANANTPGFSRQQAVFSATTPYPVPALQRGSGVGQLGTGVTVAEVERIRDAFTDQQIRQETQELGRWQTRRDLLSQVELVFNEPSDLGIREAMDLFWQSLQGLSQHPEDMSYRAVVRQRAMVLGDAFQDARRQLLVLRADVNQGAGVKVEEINAIAQQIASLNSQIGKVVAVGDVPNDLFDQRDLLLEQLAEIVNISVSERHQGMISVNVGGALLVEGTTAFAMTARPRADDPELIEILWERNHQPVVVESGILRGMLDFRDGDIPDYVAKLDNLASVLIDSINQVHQQGFDLLGIKGHDFFLGTDAGTIEVNPSLEDLNRLAASANGEKGDGGNARAMAQLKHQLLFNNGTANPGEFFGSLIAALGVDGQQSQVRARNQEILVAHLKDRQEMVAGVSLDEEMTNLIRFQHAYNAAARVITAMDEAVDTIINRMGLVGR
ncbi:MAG: flagellar hook-associated protein FlgK [Limnochordia bacterium]|jgi:flagellar hook-associated protein 1 FlgK